jgi:hypothetical protein
MQHFSGGFAMTTIQIELPDATARAARAERKRRAGGH